MISEQINEITNNIKEELCQLLDYEITIEKKKLNNIPLTEKEKIFDIYFVKPSTMIKIIIERGK